MPFNGSGVFEPLPVPDFPAVAGTTIEASKFNNNMQDVFVEGLSKVITRDGQSDPTANLPMAGFRHTGVGDAQLDDEYAAFGQVPGLRGALGIVDWDTIVLTGIYEGEASSLTGPSANFPPTSELGQLLVLQQGSIIVQTYFTASRQHSRQKVGATWGEWGSNTLAIVEDLTLNVPADYATINDAMEFLEGKLIAPPAIVTIQLTGTIDVNAWTTQTVNHPNGDRIRILGSATLSYTAGPVAPANPLLQIVGNLNLLDDLIFDYNPVIAAGNGTAISITGGRVVVGDGVFVVGARLGISVSDGGVLSATGVDFPFVVASLQNCSFIGLSVSGSGKAFLTAYSIDGCGINMRASTGGEIITIGGVYSGATTDSTASITGGNIIFISCITETSGDSGVYLEVGGQAALVNHISRNNGDYGLEVAATAQFPYNNSLIGWVGNTLGNFNGVVSVMAGHSAIGAETVTGFITITDRDGVTRKVAVVS